jgi:cytochrome c oxidase subunit IV
MPTESSAKTVAVSTYVGILIALLLLTALTVGLSFVEMPRTWHVGWGLGIAGLKAALVILVFMHVLHSSAATRAVILVTVFWLVGVFLVLTMSDYATRESIPGLPGH